MTLKILTIDDDPSVTQLLSMLLKIYGMDVIATNRGKQGVELVRSESPDLVLLDMMMPEMNGLEVCQAIRSFSNIPIVAYSALSDPQQVAKAREIGFNDYLEKPTPAEVIIDRIHKLTAAPQTGGA